MTKNVLFMIHGVGPQKAGWSKAAQEFLADEIELYPSFRNRQTPLDGKLVFEEIVYNDIFDSVLKRWKQLSDDFDPVSDELMPNALASINQFLGALPPDGSKKENNELVDRAGDVLLFRGLKLVQRLVLLRVARKIAEGIAKYSSNTRSPVKFGVLGHSLGTAVAHDALQVLTTTNWLHTPSGKLRRFKNVPESEVQVAADALGCIPFGPGNIRFQSIYMVSNTSALLFTTEDPHSSVVRPPIGSTRGITDKYFNINHKYDPIGYVQQFNISQWPKVVQLESAIDLRPRHIHQLNVHDLVHYLSDPEVHGHIFLELVDGFSREDFAYGLLRKQSQQHLTSHPFPKYKGNFDDDETKDRLQTRMREEVISKLTNALDIVKRRVPEAGS